MTILFNAGLSNTWANRVAAAALGAVLLASPGLAIAQAAPAAPAAPTATAAPAAKTAPSRMAPGAAIETRITALHSQLEITAAQESSWNAFAQVMRDNAKNTGALIVAREKKAKTMTAAEDVHAYQAIAQAHADDLAKLATAFDTLYATMSDAQKKNADHVFSRRPARATPPKAG
jgi:protein CpxP